jgi:hypothetical protein
MPAHINSSFQRVTSAGATTTVTLNYTPTGVGNLVALLCYGQSAAGGTVTLSDSHGNTIITIDSNVQGLDGLEIGSTFYVQKILSGTAVFLATFTNTATSKIFGIMLDEFSGCTTVDRHSLAGVATTAGGNYTSSSLRNNIADEALWGATYCTNSASVGAGFTKGADDGIGNISEYQIISSIANQAVTFSDSSGNSGVDELVAMATFFNPSINILAKVGPHS